MISWNDPSLVLVILIIKTTKTNQKKSHYFFFFSIVNFIIRINDFHSEICKTFFQRMEFFQQQTRDHRFSIRAGADIIDEIFRHFFFFSSPSPNDSSWNVTNSQRCCPFSRLPFFGRSRFFAPLPCIRTINTRNFRSGWGQMDETSFSPEN